MKDVKIIMIFIAGNFASIALAGGSQGGGTPPALQDLQQDLMMRPSFDGGLFNKGDDIGLLTRVKLQPQMLVGSERAGTSKVPEDGTVGGGGPAGLQLSNADVSILRDRKAPIEAVSAQGGNLLFDIEAGESLKEVVLKHKRLKMRESLEKANSLRVE